MKKFFLSIYVRGEELVVGGPGLVSTSFDKVMRRLL